VFPIAHYQMGGIEVDTDMATRVPGLYAAGEVVGGANGANRLSGNALPEALVFGERAGERAATYAKRRPGADWDAAIAAPYLDAIRGIVGRNGSGLWPAHLMRELKELMWTKVGAFRRADDLAAARDRINAMRLHDLDALAVTDEASHNTSLVEWCELRNGLLAAEAVALAALNRRESRGAHQRVDFPRADDHFRRSQHIALRGQEFDSDFNGGRR
jgi:succinate dehydrogenase/fumarate reductase flavoprotein subunit